MKTTLTALLLAAAGSCESCPDKNPDQPDRAICDLLLEHMNPPFSCEIDSLPYHCTQASGEILLYPGQFSSPERPFIHYPHTHPSLLLTNHTTGAFCLAIHARASQQEHFSFQPSLVSYH